MSTCEETRKGIFGVIQIAGDAWIIEIRHACTSDCVSRKANAHFDDSDRASMLWMTESGAFDKIRKAFCRLIGSSTRYDKCQDE
jgi:hypothetical protein